MWTRHSTSNTRGWLWRRRLFDARDIVAAVRTVVPAGARPVEHHEALLGEPEALAASMAVTAGFGSYAATDKFEEMVAGACNAKHAVAMSSGTAALHVALLCVGVKPGDAVLVPSLTFIGTAAAVVHAGAVPVFVDVGNDLGLAPHKLAVYLQREASRGPTKTWLKKSSRRIGAIVPVHLFGQPCRIGEIRSVGRAYGIPVVEDAAEALGSQGIEGACGSLGDVGVISFNVNKIVSTGGGGALVTSDPEIARRARKLSTTARIAHKWEVSHDAVAWNYRMPGLCAAVGVAQMARLPDLLRLKRALAGAYTGALMSVHGVHQRPTVPGQRQNNWLWSFLIDPRWEGGRDEVLSALWDAGLRARAAFTPMHKLPVFAGCVADNPLVSEDAHARVVCLPSGPALGGRFL